MTWDTSSSSSGEGLTRAKTMCILHMSRLTCTMRCHLRMDMYKLALGFVRVAALRAANIVDQRHDFTTASLQRVPIAVRHDFA